MKSYDLHPEENSTDKPKKKVQTPVRWNDLNLYRRLLNRIHQLGEGKLPKDQPKLNGLIQEAVRFYLDATRLQPSLTAENSRHSNLELETNESPVEFEDFVSDNTVSLQALGQHADFGPMIEDFEYILRGKQERAIHPLSENLKGFRLLTDLLLERGEAGVTTDYTEPNSPVPTEEGVNPQEHLAPPRDLEAAVGPELRRLEESAAEAKRLGEGADEPPARVAKGKSRNRGGAPGRRRD